MVKRKNRFVVPLLCWAVLTAISLSCSDIPPADRYMKIESILPVSTSINEPITVSVNISGKGGEIATGTVTVGGDTQCVITLVNGKGSCQMVFYTEGEHTITVNYSGDTHYTTEYQTRSYTVVAPQTPIPTIPTTLYVEAASNEATLPGESVEFLVLVSPNEGPPPSGVVTLSTEGETGCTVTLSNGKGSCKIQFNTSGEKTVNAAFPVTDRWVSSNASTTHLVNYPTEITMTIAPVSPVVTQVVQVEVVVAVIGGGPAPIGTVSITAGLDEGCGDIDLVDGAGSCSFSFKSIGTTTVEALFIPIDENGNASMENFRECRTSVDVTVREVPVPEPTQPTSVEGGGGGDGGGGGGAGCEVYDPNSDSWICIAPCPYDPPPPHTCTP